MNRRVRRFFGTRFERDTSMADALHFLLVYDAKNERLVGESQYEDPQRAELALSEAEMDHRRDDLQVVLLTAPTRDTLVETHPHFFLRSDDRAKSQDTIGFPRVRL